MPLGGHYSRTGPTKHHIFFSVFAQNITYVLQVWSLSHLVLTLGSSRCECDTFSARPNDQSASAASTNDKHRAHLKTAMALRCS